MKRLVIFLFFTLAACGNKEELVCQPCQNTWPMEKMVASSQLIILAKRIDNKFSNKYQQGEEMNELETLEVLKSDGKIEIGDKIEVQSWYGMCPYGLQMNRYENAVVFLNEVSSGGLFSEPVYEVATYKNALCNDEAMTVKGSNLVIWDPGIRQEVKYPMEEFRRVFLGAQPQQTPIPQNS